MKEKIILIAIVFLTTICTINISAEEENLNLVCTNSILSDFTSNLLTENVNIEYIMPAGVCPAFYDTTPGDVSKIVNADILISFGDTQMEPWLTDLLAYNTECEIIECKDLGEWNIPTGAKAYVNHLSEQLKQILPEQENTIQTNTENYLAQIDTTSDNLKQLVETFNYQNTPIICMQWQEDFLKWLGLDVVYSYGPPQGLSAQDEIDMINTIGNNDVCAIIDNLQSGTDYGAHIASETGISHIIFTNFPGAIPGTDNYLDMITYNTNQLIQGIDTYNYKQGEISALNQEISQTQMQRDVTVFIALAFIILTILLFIMYKRK
jgi:ABC-type Zn uptake system ZnuABC Zn-binding protein ZnuA